VKEELVYEVIPVASGVVIALLISQIAEGRMRWITIGVLSVVVGFVAATISGEISESVAFVLFDAAQCVLAAAVTLYAVARWSPALRR
jgi:uncharacterized protein YacL